MPRKKISIEEAFATLEQAGIPIQLKPVVAENHVEPTPEPVIPTGRRKGQIFDTSPKPTKPATHTRVTLFAKHSIGSGGRLVIDSDGTRRAEHTGVESYGPGICMVPVEHATHLLHADALARQADQRFLDTTMHSYIVVPRQANGQRANIAVEVDGGMLGWSSIEHDLPSQYMHIVQ